MLPAAPSGPARFFYVIGIIAAFAGASLFIYAVFTTLAEGFTNFDTNFSDGYPAISAGRPDFARIGRVIPLAIGLAIPGIFVATLASALGPHPDRVRDVHIGDRIHGPVAKGHGQMYIQGNVQGTYTSMYFTQIALGEIADISNVISGLQLPANDSRDIQGYLAEADRELRQPQPNTERIADFLGRAANLMNQVGAFARAGGELVPRLQHLASLLGTAGAALSQWLPL